MVLEKTTARIPAGYEELFEGLDVRIAKNQERDVEAIIMEATEKDRDFQFRRKVIVIVERHKMQDHQGDVSQAKQDIHYRVTGIFFDVGSMVSSGAMAYAGQTPIAGLFQLVEKMFSSTGNWNEKKNQSEMEGQNHRYQQISTILSEQSQQIQLTEREGEKDSSLIDRVMQMASRMIELLASSSS